MPGPEPQAVVIVEDDSGMSHALERILRIAGFRPVAYCSAEALIEADGAANAACLILDVHLPGLSGFELRRCLAEKGSKAPVIFISAYDELDSRERAMKAGAVAYLTKPFPGQTLLEKVAIAMGAEMTSGRVKAKSNGSR